MPQASKAERERVLAVFRAAYEAGALAGLVRLLHPDAVYVTDGGGKVSAARVCGASGTRTASTSPRSAASSPRCSTAKACASR
ncbi:hypothetical protein AB0B12_08585 [Streptomyces sp. NPDC044780]|uniref:hypothetical protein n=1 Tax=unclassified Streptomyces TaxID=2593676 RepID=UPI0033E4BFD9